MSKKVVVVGGGPAGMMAAGVSGKHGNETVLLEKNKQLGKKLLITGKGRCNITNNTDIQGLIDNTPGNGAFLYSAFYTFSNEDLIKFFNEMGLETKVERGGRVFPLSDKSADVVGVLSRFVKQNKVKILFESTAQEIIAPNNEVKGIVLKDGRKIKCDSIILATGGLSYPSTGSTGDGYKLAESLGHSIIELKPSLVPLETSEEWVKELQGLSLKNITITMVDSKGKKLYSEFGEMLFTHFGVSGPVILSSSRHISDYKYKNVKLLIDLKPALTEERLDDRLKRDFEKYSRKQFKNSLRDLLPQKMIPVIINLSGIPHDKFVNQITKQERQSLATLLKGLELNITGSRPVEEAIITAGGVCTDEINPSTMESKIIKGLYFAGEIIDVDAYTGGYNLTIAFSTGYIAGTSC
jgi:predicted Rossmann fold flavoprotein